MIKNKYSRRNSTSNDLCHLIEYNLFRPPLSPGVPEFSSNYSTLPAVRQSDLVQVQQEKTGKSTRLVRWTSQPGYDSFHSCPDLSTLQISSSSSSPSSSLLPNATANGYEATVNTTTTAPTSRSPSPQSTVSLRNGPRTLAATRKRVSKKARGVLGKVRAFQRIAAAKMAHPTIKIDTSVQATKRALPEDNEVGLDIIYGSDDAPGLDAGDTESVPPFLCQSVLEIHQKFEELEWMQRMRLLEGTQANDPSHRWALEADPEVRARNRYMNVQAWANSRIHLRVPEGECDFINASPIVLQDSVSQQARRYIATQGPKLGHVAHFWQMVFHESKDVGVVVMLTQTFESGREKCSQYFPLNRDSPSMPLRRVEFDQYSSDDEQHSDGNLLGEVTLLETSWDPASRSEIRKLQLTFGGETKTVWHFLFAGWADYSKPEGDDRDALLQLIKLSGSKSAPENPRIVHCSAGVGRTGTFIALDHLLQELESGQLLEAVDPEIDPVFETVNQMREQRMMMVYNEMQLQFIYEVLREQTDLKLGKAIGRKLDERSTKMAKLSVNEVNYLPSSKPELEPAEENPSTPTRSWSGTPEVSDNE
ncbi:tyrosine protein phosphatase PTP1 [Aspergillus homomorphus CBS 101889]|uniref:Protein-tyrosine phosphatase 2 n=1 Tax=Aspergillus homomorphus (strain CBS 101889) TaxID=1450537 RepID=A0A395I5U7_ASPHC|nr:hypothetical protein BO97DRAFT_468397 [Aspergillus homomorphus CBS 101889]RAL15480.1 hypothetical protein BO97DRAFT_468397 [Aspergillus homomorphus CBS 101889]